MLSDAELAEWESLEKASAGHFDPNDADYYCISPVADWLAFRSRRIREHIDALTAERDKLQAYKAWTHSYLDQHGVPHHPPGTHGAEGCRIGDRMDWLMAELEATRGCKPDEYELIRSSERAAQEARRHAEKERDRLAERVRELEKVCESSYGALLQASRCDPGSEFYRQAVYRLEATLPQPKAEADHHA
jgi:hypothetical protein